MGTGVAGTGPYVLPGLAPVGHVLDNGLSLLVKSAHTTPAVTVQALFRAGSAYDRVPGLGEQEGTAYFLSRMLDRGSRDRTAADTAEAFEACGARLETVLTRLALNVSCTCLAEDFDRVLALLGEMLVAPTFPEAEVDKVRSEIETSLRQDLDNPATVASERLFAELYPGDHPYGHPVKGTSDNLVRIARDELQAFHAGRVHPASCSLAIVGDVSAERAIESAARVFGAWPRVEGVGGTAPPFPARAEPGRARRTVVVPMSGKSQTDIAYGLTTISRADPAYHAFLVMNCALGQYALGGRLGSSIRERQGMAYYAFTGFDPDLVPTPLVVRAGVDPANVDRTVASIDEEIERIARDGLEAEELADCKRYLIGSMPRSLETNAGIARFLQSTEFFELGRDYDLRLPALLEAVTLDQVNAAARTLSPDRATVVVAGPPATES